MLSKQITPTRHDLWFLPLGGTGEIGMNMNLYGHDGEWLMVDCGIGFDHENGRSRYIADAHFIEQQSSRLQAIVITHAHEDHIGAIMELWPKLKVPIFATQFAIEVIFNKLSKEAWAAQVPLHIVSFHQRYEIGGFSVTWLPLPHSIPEACALLIETDIGNILHTGDWKKDDNPVIGSAFDAASFAALKSLPIDVMVADSTNATKQGSSRSESRVYPGLLKTIKAQPGRVVVTCFSSNVARFVTLVKIAHKLKKHCAIFGRSLENMVSIAKRLGYWPEGLTLVDPKHIGYLPKEEVMVIATGSQAEPRSATQKLAHGFHPWLCLEEGDTIIYSAIKIPPNIKSIDQQISHFETRGVNVIHADDTEKEGVVLHASGHPCQQDLIDFYKLIEPDMLIPTHGEPEHLQAHQLVAESAGIHKVLSGQNGDLFKIKPFEKKLSDWVAVGKIQIG